METKKSSWIKVLEIAPNKIKNLLRIIYALYLEILAPALGAWKEVEEPIKKTVMTLIFSILTLISAFLIAFFGKLEAMAGILAITSAALSLIIGTLGSKIGALIANISGYKLVKETGQEIEKLFKPLSIIGAIMAFVGAMISIWGFESFLASNLLLIIIISSYFGIMGVVQKRSIEEVYKIMNWWVIISLVLVLGNRVYPQIKEYADKTDNPVVLKMKTSGSRLASLLEKSSSNDRRKRSVNKTAASATYAKVLADSIFFLERGTLDSSGEISNLEPVRISEFKTVRNGQKTITDHLQRGDMILISDEENRGYVYRTERYTEVIIPDSEYGKFAYGQTYYIRSALIKPMDGLAIREKSAEQDRSWRKKQPQILSAKSPWGTVYKLKPNQPYYLAEWHTFKIGEKYKDVPFTFQFNSGRKVSSFALNTSSKGILNFDEPFRIISSKSIKIKVKRS